MGAAGVQTRLAAKLEIVAQVQPHLNVGLHAQAAFHRPLGAAHHHVAAQAGRGLVGQHDQGRVGLEIAAQLQGGAIEQGAHLA